MVPSIPMYHNNSIKYQSVDYTQLNVKTVLFQAIQINMSEQFKYQNNPISSNSV